ncbi:MAG: T9SS type A sorting domain-containing protein [Chitinophagales bacterium]
MTFNKTIDFSNGDETGFSVITINDGYILSGTGWGYEMDDYFDFKLKYVKIDLDGNIIWQKVVGDSATNYFCPPRSGELTNDNKIVLGITTQTLATSLISILKFDPITGDTIFFRHFDYDDYMYANQIKEFTDGSLVILGWDSNDTFGSVLIKTTSEGNFVWDKRYGLGEASASDFENKGKDTLYLLNNKVYCSPPGYWLREIDSAGNESSNVHFTEDCPDFGLPSITGGFFGVGSYFPQPPYRSFIFRTDSTGEILWHYDTTIDFDTLIYGQLFPAVVEELPSGDIFVSGYFASNISGSYVGLVSKINLSGIPYWERFYTANEDIYDDNRLHDMALTNDGGLIITGAAYSDNEIEDQNFWVLKLDSMGCLIPGCDTIGDAIMELPFEKAGILIFPNPVKEEAIIQITFDSSPAINTLSFQLTDILGKSVMESEIGNSDLHIDGNKVRFSFHRKLIPAGIYLLNIYSNDILIGSEKVILK